MSWGNLREQEEYGPHAAHPASPIRPHYKNKKAPEPQTEIVRIQEQKAIQTRVRLHYFYSAVTETILVS